MDEEDQKEEELSKNIPLIQPPIQEPPEDEECDDDDDKYGWGV